MFFCLLCAHLFLWKLLCKEEDIELVTSPLSGCQICSEVFFSDSSPGHFYALIQTNFQTTLIIRQFTIDS